MLRKVVLIFSSLPAGTAQTTMEGAGNGGPVESQPWHWTARALAPVSIDGRKAKCSVRLLDTVFFSPEMPLSESTWLFTSKHGTVTLKKQEQVTAPKIIERFTRFALMNPLNVDEIVGTSISASAGTKSLGATDLEALLEQQQQRRRQQQAGTSEAVQVYLRPRGGAEETFIVE